MVTRPRNLQQADPYFDSVVLLAPLSGEDGDTTSTDLSNDANTLTFNGSAALDGDIRKFGFTSLLCDGAVTFSAQPLVDAGMATGDWTVEFWYRPDGTASVNDRLFQTRNGDFVSGIYIAHEQFNANQIGFGYDTNGSTPWDYLSGGTAVTANTWYHIALVRNGSDFRLYLDGTSVANTTYAGSIYLSGSDTCVIGAQTVGSTRANSGWIENFRITSVARYTSAFTPPERAYPTVQNVDGLILDSLQIHLDAGNTSSYPGSGNTWFDLSGNGNDAAYQDTTAPFDSDGGGSFDFELSAGANDYFDITDDESLEPGETWSLCFWVKTGNVTGQQYISNKHSNDLAIICGYQTSAINLYWDGYRPSAAATQMSNANDEWTHYAYTKDSNGLSDNVKGYKNGVELVSETVSYTIPNGASSYRLGATGTGAAYYKGKISVWMQYSRPLSVAEVLANFNTQKSRFGL